MASEPLLAGKYKNPEELERAYLEAQKKISEVGEKAKVADLIQEKYGMSPDELRRTIEQQEQAAMEQQYRENPGAFAVQKVQELEAKLALTEVQTELDTYLREHPESAANRDKILKLALSSEKDKSFEDIDREWFGATRAQGQKDAYKKIDAKVKTQTTGTQSAPKKQFTEADLNNMSAAEMEAILPWADVSHRPY